MQNNIVHVDGSRAVLSTVLKNGQASTIDVVQGIKDLLPLLREQLPPELKIDVMSDQSVFVKAAVKGVLYEGAIAAALTSLMILLFLGSWRSTVIIATSIPLAVLAALMGLWATGQTLNIMTLGGLALAVGILVDDATVTIENINWHLEQGKGVYDAIMDGARQIAQPAFVSLLCICVAFVPMFSLAGHRGLPVRAHGAGGGVRHDRLLHPVAHPGADPGALSAQAASGHMARGRYMFWRGCRSSFERGFANVQGAVSQPSGAGDDQPPPLRLRFPGRGRGLHAAGAVPGPRLLPQRGFRPDHPACPHARRHPRRGHQPDRGADRKAKSAASSRRAKLATIVDNVGLNQSPVNMLYNNSGTVGLQDADIFISLNKGHGPTADYVRTLRERLPRLFPQVTFSFPPPDITSQILNFGAPAPLDVQMTGNRLATRPKPSASASCARSARFPAWWMRACSSPATMPQLKVDADRSRMAQVGLTERDVTNALATAMAGTSQSAPNFWLNPKNGVSYNMTAQTPEYQLTPWQRCRTCRSPAGASGGARRCWAGWPTSAASQGNSVVTHYNIHAHHRSLRHHPGPRPGRASPGTCRR